MEIRVSRRMRPSMSHHRGRCWGIIITLLLFLVCKLGFTQPKQFDDETNNKYNSDKAYEWDSWDYYQILGLASTLKNQERSVSRQRRVKERSKIKAKDIKKAYRKQAQLWHPDKITSKKSLGSGTNSSSNNNSTNVSLEESNARFARIAQAYETLSNENQRLEYDLFLLNQEDEQSEELKRRQKQQEYDDHHHTYNSQESHPTESSFQRENPYTSSIFHTDPWELFENFFFGSSSHYNIFDDLDSFTSESTLHQQQQQHDSTSSSPNGASHDDTFDDSLQPSRVSESTQVRYDAQLGGYVHRVLHREEYDHYPPSESHHSTPSSKSKSTTYFRVIGQEFMEEFHPFYGYSLGYTPISDPYLVEEGYIPPMQEDLLEQEILRNQDPLYSNTQQQRRKRLTHTSSILTSRQYISTKNAQYLRSENQFYYAGLTSDCELVVMYDKAYETNNTWIEDILVWTSESYIPYSYLQAQGGSCFLALYDGQLAVVVGENPDEPISVLWSSPKPSPYRHERYNAYDDNDVDYYVSLDNDGSLVVYRRRRRSDHVQDEDETIFYDEPEEKDDYMYETKYRARASSTGDEHVFYSLLESIQSNWKQWWLRAIQTTKRASRIPPKTHAARAWKSLQRWAIKTLTGESISSSHRSFMNRPPNEKKYLVDECVFASSPVGCITSGRLFIQASKNLQRNISKNFGNVDKVWEKLIASLTDANDDLLDTMMRLLDKVGTQVGKTGIKIASKGMSNFHRAAKAAQEAFQKTGWKETSDWTED